MFIHAVPDNRGKRDGYYCSLVESYRDGGKSVHSIRLSFGFVHSERLPYLKAAFNQGNPAEIFERERRRLESKRHEHSGNSYGKQA